MPQSDRYLLTKPEVMEIRSYCASFFMSLNSYHQKILNFGAKNKSSREKR